MKRDTTRALDPQTSPSVLALSSSNHRQLGGHITTTPGEPLLHPHPGYVGSHLWSSNSVTYGARLIGQPAPAYDEGQENVVGKPL